MPRNLGFSNQSWFDSRIRRFVAGQALHQCAGKKGLILESNQE